MEDMVTYNVGKAAPIEGLKELQTAIAEWVAYQVRRQRYKDGEEGFDLEMPEKPKTNVDELKAKYPRAAAFIMANNWYNTGDWKKKSLGMEAMKRIYAGEDHVKVIEEMQSGLLAWKLAQEG